MENTLIVIIGGAGALGLEMGAVVAAALMLKEAGADLISHGVAEDLCSNLVRR